MITLSCFHTQDSQWSRKKSRKVIFIISTITIDLQSHGHENDKQFSPGPTPGREHQHTFNETSNYLVDDLDSSHCHGQMINAKAQKVSRIMADVV